MKSGRNAEEIGDQTATGLMSGAEVSDTPTEPRFKADLKNLGHRASAGAIGGIVCGLLVGGVGGRLAMFLLRLTSGPPVFGLESDDGFTMGSFTSSTVFLLMATAALGLVGGLAYVLVRGWMPEKIRPLLTAGVFALLAAPAIIRPEGVDFTIVRPAVLAIALFILLPGLFGYLMARLVERLLARQPGRIVPWLGVPAVMLPIMFLGTGAGGLGGISLLILIAAWVTGWRIPTLRRLPSMVGVKWAGRGALAAGTAAAAVFLIIDIVKVL